MSTRSYVAFRLLLVVLITLLWLSEILPAILAGTTPSSIPVAHVGTAIGSGTDVAIEAAGVTLMRDDPYDVVRAIRISDATLEKIKQNPVWALGYNTTLIPLASLGLLPPVLAAAAMAFSSASVLSNSLLFRRYVPGHDYELLGPFRR